MHIELVLVLHKLTYRAVFILSEVKAHSSSNLKESS